MLLEVSGLHAAYGATRVIHGIGFAMEEKSITALLGANGAGKTTTLRALCGMVKTEGQIMPHKARKVVVLPAPFAPSKAVIDFSSIAKPIPWITRVAP